MHSWQGLHARPPCPCLHTRLHNNSLQNNVLYNCTHRPKTVSKWQLKNWPWGAAAM